MPSVPGFVHTPGHHCGSTALRNLLGFHGVEISEETAFGLGAGAGFYYLAMEDASPSRWFNGRTARLEETFRELTGAALELRTFAEANGEAAWEAARSEVDAGRPALLLTDIYYLDHYGNSAHFPGHAVVLAGYDDEVAHLSDTAFEELQTTRLENLARARHSGHPAYPLEGHMFTVGEAIDRAQLEAAVPRAIARAASEMLEPPFGEFAGVPALERLAAEVDSWPKAVSDWQWCARFAYQVIERRGTGGGCFRLMYSRFLEEAGREEAPLAAAAAARWTELAEAFKAASEEDEPRPELWGAVGEGAQQVLEAERRLWTALADSAA
ncbi:MAG TPA: BtrH N-terminal domain-containing protein [Solirubrobacterales bacterium]|nr:BtrH N-terminal domain-containing protein [Solirubrobacterales bacterium]